MNRRILHDEHGEVKHGVRRVIRLPRAPAHPDPALINIRGKHVVTRIHMHDIGELRDRPIGPYHAFWCVMDRVFCSQTLEIGPKGVGLEERWMRGVHRRKINSRWVDKWINIPLIKCFSIAQLDGFS